MIAARVLALGTLGACTTFEDPAVVLDLRPIALTATPPEQVVDVDLANPKLADLVAQLEPAFVCAYVSDPGRSRPLRWSMTACVRGDDTERCDPEAPSIVLGGGVLDDPELAPGPVCAAIQPDGNLVGLLVAAFERDPLRGAAGLDYAVVLRVGGIDDDPASDQFAAKMLRISARLPAERVPNANPTLDELQQSLTEFEGPPSPIGFCNAMEPVVVPQGARVRLFPLESADARQRYFVPRIDGSFVELDETLTYQWYATAGEFNAHVTGGPRDPFGNEPPLGASWFAPEVRAPLDVQLWVVQRDERFGVAAYPTCFRVVP